MSDSDIEEEGNPLQPGNGDTTAAAATGVDGLENGVGGDGGEGGATKQGGKPRGPSRGVGHYDYEDDFLDDTEFFDLVIHADKRKPKYDGFFVTRGKIEREEEEEEEEEEGEEGEHGMMVNGETKKKKKKKKRFDGERGGGEGGGGEKKQKKRRVGETGEEVPTTTQKKNKAAVAGGKLVSPGGTKPSKPPQAPYNPPSEILAGIEQLRTLAASFPSPPFPTHDGGPAAAATTTTTEGGGGDEDGGKQKVTKKMPPPLRTALKEFSATFLGEVSTHGAAAKSRILTELMAFMEPFTTRSNLNLTFRYQERKPSGTGQQQPVAGGSGGTLGAAAAAVAPSPIKQQKQKQQQGMTLPPPPQQQQQEEEGPTPTLEELRNLIATQVTLDPLPPIPPALEIPPDCTTDGTDGGGGGTFDVAEGADLTARKEIMEMHSTRWKKIPKNVRDKMYAYMKTELAPALKINSASGEGTVNQVMWLFPQGTVTKDTIKKIYTTCRVGENKNNNKRAAAAAAGAERTSVPPDMINMNKTIASPAAAVGRAMQMLSPPPLLGSSNGGGGMVATSPTANSPANVAISKLSIMMDARSLELVNQLNKARQENASGEVMTRLKNELQIALLQHRQQQLQQQQVQRSGGQSPVNQGGAPNIAAMAAAMGAAAAAAQQQQQQQQGFEMARPPIPPPAIAPSLAANLPPLAAAPKDTTTTTTPSTIDTDTNTNTKVEPTMSDEDIINAGIAHGAPVYFLRTLLSSEKRKYHYVLVRALMVMGPSGATTTEVVAKANDLQVGEGWPYDTTKKGGFTTATHSDWCAHLPTGQGQMRKYALKCFPGVEHVPRVKKHSSGASGSGEEQKSRGKKKKKNSGSNDPSEPQPGVVEETEIETLDVANPDDDHHQGIIDLQDMSETVSATED